MITKLTIEQEQKIKEYYDFYLAKGLSTKPANRLVAENAVKELYKLIKEKEPKCLWVNSPIELIALFKKSNLESNLWGNLWGNLESNLESNLWGNLESNLWGNLESNLWGNLWGNLRRGQLNSPWISFYDYYRTVVTNTFSAEDNHRLDLYIDLLDCSYFITLRNFVILIDHPLAFHVDGQGKTHNHLNHAIKFRDDTGIYVIHGQQLNETEFNDKKKLLEQKKITNLEYLEMESVA